MSTRIEPTVVIGAGAVGSAAAYHLTLRGQRALVLEQFAAGHARGSSHGAARITRHSYADPAYAGLMVEAFRCWRRLEADCARALYIRTGGVSFCPAEVDYVRRVAANLVEIAIPHQRMSGSEWKRRHPMISLPATYDVVFEPDAGLLSAACAVEAMQSMAVERGAKWMCGLAVRQIEQGGDGVRIVCACVDPATGQPTGETREIRCERLVVAAGAWAGRLVPELGSVLRPTLQQVRYLRPLHDGSTAIGRMPVFIYMGSHEEDAFYGMPDFLASGVKVARHGGPAIDPDEYPRAQSQDGHAQLREFLRRHLAALADAPVVNEETCLYTMAPGDRFVVGPLPRMPSVIVASPCSGHGFKFSCLVGKAVAELLIDGESAVGGTAWTTPID